ncbi:hypothetical protein CCYA_CCYA03G1033 [Cyanidiococcus yangmingshanensis]|nr:hypothetical protein CCYA_CCYA03G1033 [Cyanidiococcus yangmingshanensis]
MQSAEGKQKSSVEDSSLNDQSAIESFLNALFRISPDGDAVAAVCDALLFLLEGSRSDQELESDVYDIVGDPEFAAIILQQRRKLHGLGDEIRARLSVKLATRLLCDPAVQREKCFSAYTADKNSAELEFADLGRSQHVKTSGPGSEFEAHGFPTKSQWLEPARTYSSRGARKTMQSVQNNDGLRMVDEGLRHERGGSEVHVEDLYREIFVPPPIPCHEDQPRLRITECIDPPLQKIFEHIEYLNPVQSAVFQAVYNTAENLLICAPTGAGKTNIALLAIAKELRQRTTSKSWRCVYIAPMRALASEIVCKFAVALRPLGVEVLEYTGDTNPSIPNVQRSQVFVTTPEKWDVLSRNSIHWHAGVAASLRLLIIDEIHLLHDDRGPVLEAVVARTLRMVENQQRMVRMVGLSATLPNYMDIAEFLRVNPQRGLFYFDQGYRPVPLGQRFVGIRKKHGRSPDSIMVEVCYEKMRSFLVEGHQIIVFVHSRKKTKWLAGELLHMARERNDVALLTPMNISVQNSFQTAKSSEVKTLLTNGIGIHHAGLARADRQLVEQMFRDGLVRLLVSTATLAWGINLPARAVLIYGTKIYDAKRGGFVDIGILDVLQIFGRAGRPQFDNYGEGIILTEEQRLAYFYRLLSLQLPIESQILNGFAIVDHLNAEIATGYVTSEQDALAWFGSLYISTRLAKNPLHYGVAREEVENDRALAAFRSGILKKSIDALVSAGLVFGETGLSQLEPTDWGIVACRFYISYHTIQMFRENLHSELSMAEIIYCISLSSEFEQVLLREEEIPELEELYTEACPYEFPLSKHRSRRSKLGDESEYWLNNSAGKVYVLFQAYVSQTPMRNFALLSDMKYIEESSTRLLSAIFEISIRNGWPSLARRASELARAVEQRVWPFDHPLAQAHGIPVSMLDAIKKNDISYDLQVLREYSEAQWLQLLGSATLVRAAREILAEFPHLEIDGSIQPITENLARIHICCTPRWKCGSRLRSNRSTDPARFTLWIQGNDTQSILYSRHISFSKDQVRRRVSLHVEVCLNLDGAWPPDISFVCISEQWLGADQVFHVETRSLHAPRVTFRETALLDLRPLRADALGFGSASSDIFPGMSHLNAIQSQVFHVLLHTDTSMMLGLPPNAGKDLLIFLSVLRQLRSKRQTQCRVLYLNPNPSDISSKRNDWLRQFGQIGCRVRSIDEWGSAGSTEVCNSSEFVYASPKLLLRSCILGPVHRLEQFDLILFDNLQNFNEDDGAFYEIALSLLGRKSAIAARRIGFSSLAGNVTDLSCWFSLKSSFNFTLEHSPIPLELNIIGYREQNILERLARMDQTIHKVIRRHHAQQAIVFIQSDAECLETARRLLRAAAADGSPQHMVVEECVSDMNVMNVDITQFLAFGIGLLGGAMNDTVQGFMQDLYEERKLSTLLVSLNALGGLRCRAPIVIVKGTEWSRSSDGTWKQLPIHVLLSILGHCGGPEVGRGALYLLVADSWKAFYQKLLENKIPIEAGLRDEEDICLLLCYTLAMDMARDPEGCLDLLQRTFLWRRFRNNPSFYPWKGLNDAGMRDLLEICLVSLADVGLVGVESIGTSRLHLKLTQVGKFASCCGFRPHLFKRIRDLVIGLNKEKNRDLSAEAYRILLQLSGKQTGIAERPEMKRFGNENDDSMTPRTNLRKKRSGSRLDVCMHSDRVSAFKDVPLVELAAAAALTAAQSDVACIVVPLLKLAVTVAEDFKQYNSQSELRFDRGARWRLVRLGSRRANIRLYSPEATAVDVDSVPSEVSEKCMLPDSMPSSPVVCFLFSSSDTQLLGSAVSHEPFSGLVIECMCDIPKQGSLSLKIFYLLTAYLQELIVQVES